MLVYFIILVHAKDRIISFPGREIQQFMIGTFFPRSGEHALIQKDPNNLGMLPLIPSFKAFRSFP